MKEMKRLISVDKASFTDIMMQLWKFVLHDPNAFTEGAPMIDCTKHAIPKKQSEEILTLMLDNATRLDQASIGLNYINIAPSTYED